MENNNNNNEKKSFVNKLYLDPIENINTKVSKTKGFRIKQDQSKTNEESNVLKSMHGANLTLNTLNPINTNISTNQNQNFSNMNKTSQMMGSVIIQNWETAKNIPNDIGDFIHFPIIVDRNKFRIKTEQDNQNLFTSTAGPGLKFSKAKIRKDGEMLLKSINTTNNNFNFNNMNNMNMTSPTNYFSSQQTTGPNQQMQMQMTQQQMAQSHFFPSATTESAVAEIPQDERKINLAATQQLTMSGAGSTQIGEEKGGLIQVGIEDGDIQQQQQQALMTSTMPVVATSTKPDKKQKLIDFTTFNKHLYLRDNDFLYAKRVGGPVDFTLCTYQDINQKARIANNGPQSVTGRKLLPSIKAKRKNVEYITISKNTVLHYQKGVPSVYSIQEWIDNFDKYKQLMKISLFKNFKNAKLFDLWRRFYKKTKRQYYTEKLKKRFFFIDKHLLTGILETRQALKPMKVTNIFEMRQISSVLLNQFNELHKSNLVNTNKKIEGYRSKAKAILSTACNSSYQEYKMLKKITLDDNVATGGEENKNERGENTNTENNKNETNNTNKKDDVGSNIQNFIKDAIPYAQDATRKTHYKKLLRYIRVMDYVFNEAKFESIEYSLEMLDKKFKRLYECFLNNWVDPPIIITKILTMGEKIYYNPNIRTIYEDLFDKFIQETIYCVIYKKNFIDPQEFPKYMSCFEEVFEVSVDQNSNLNLRIKESPPIKALFHSLRDNFELCHQELDKEVEKLRPILESYLKYSKIDFVVLQNTASPTYLKDLLVEFHEQEQIIKQLKPFVNIGIFEFQLEDLLEKVRDAPLKWLEKIDKVIPNVLLAKVNSSIERMNKHLVALSTNPSDVESFIKLKKAVEACNNEKALHLEMSNDILDLQSIIDSYKEIKLQEFDTKKIIELKDISVQYDRKLDATSYFIDNNIQQFRADLKNEIKKFDETIKSMTTELNNETLNTYNEDPFNALDYLEESSSKIKKCLIMKEKYQQQEDDLEIDENFRSSFENLDNLVYEQKLKSDLWNSVSEFQDCSREWDKEQVLNIKLDKMKESIKKWIDICQVAMVDIDIPQVPIELKKRVEEYENLVPILEAIQNPNINQVPPLLANLQELLRTESKLEDQFFTCSKTKHLPDIFNRIPEFKELIVKANEEKRLKDLVKATIDTFYPRKLPIKLTYNKNDFDKEFEFVEENLRMLNKIFLNKYYLCVVKELEPLTENFQKYHTFLTYYVYYQKYVLKSEGIMENQEAQKEADFKKGQINNLRNNLYKYCKDYPTIQKFLDHAYKKCMDSIEILMKNYDQVYKAITAFFDKKRKETPKFYLLSNNDINEIYQARESYEIRQKTVYKIYPWIKAIKFEEDQPDEPIEIITIDNEEIIFKPSKTGRSLKEMTEILDTFLVKKIKDIYKQFKKDYDSQKKGNKNSKDTIDKLLSNKDNLAQAIFICIFYLVMDSLSKSLFLPDEAFDKLFDFYNDIKDEKIVNLMNQVKDPNTPSIQRRILLNLISLFNYTKTVIESLIREDVTSDNDYNFVRLMNPRIENDTYTIHFLSYSIEYGYEYVGLQDNFLIIPDSERMFLSFAHAVHYKRPFQIYGLEEGGKKETLKVLANLCGKRIQYYNATKNFSRESFDMIFNANLKYGFWLCIDESQNIKYDVMEVLANRIADLYRLFQASPDNDSFFEEEKILCNISQLSIFFYRNLSFEYPYKKESLPKIIKNYYRHIAMPKIDIKLYLDQTFANLSFENHEEITNYIIYVMNYAVCKFKILRQKNMTISLTMKIATNIINHLHEFEPKDIKLHLRRDLKKIFDEIISAPEKEDYRKFLNEVFSMKDFSEDLPAPVNNNNNNEEENAQKENIDIVEDTIKKELLRYKINNQSFQTKIKNLYESLEQRDNFIITGPPLSGKTTLIGLLHEVSKKLNTIDSTKYPELLNVRIYPKSKNIEELFSEHKPGRGYKFYNNYFYNMISLFDDDSREILKKLNQHYSSLMGYIPPEVEEELTPEKLKKVFTKEEEEFTKNEDEEGTGITYHREIETNKDNIYKILIFDGQIDDTWIEYLNNSNNNFNFLTLANGDKINFRDRFKIFYETTSLKNAPPSFLIKQTILANNYEQYNWDSILYTWIESNQKVIENNVLKNYVRGLFENYFPKISDFIEHNKFKNVTISNNYIMRTLISIFDSIFPMFNFEDVKIGRRNFNVAPKIEIIKKCSLSMFIFSCAWTMNLLSNFVIKTKIEKLISDIFKADDLKGPVFDYYIDENTNDFELWTNILKEPYYTYTPGAKGSSFNYGQIFIHTNETIPYFWLCEKLLELNVPFFFNGRESSGKSFLVDTVLTKKMDEDLEVLKIKMVASYYTRPEEAEKFLFNNVCVIKRDLFGDKFVKETCFFIDDVSLNINKDKYGTSPLLEFLREVTANKCLFDSYNNDNRFLKKFNCVCCGNLSGYPNNDEFNRYMAQYLMITFVTTDDYYVSILKPTLEFHFRNFIPNTSGITASQYLQASIKLNNLMKSSIKQEPKKLHVKSSIRDVIRVIQSMHDFSFKGSSDYPEYLKKLFFYESSMVYESKFTKKQDIELFRNKICEAYSSVFKQDKLTITDIYNETWTSNETYIFCKDYDNFNKDNEQNKNEHCYLEKKQTLIDFINGKIDIFYRSKDIKDKNYIKVTGDNLNSIIRLMRFFENNNFHTIMIGKECTGKRNLFDFACFLGGIEILEIDNSYSHETNKTQESFINNTIVPFLINATVKNKKTILYVPPTVKVPFVYDSINKLLDIKEIPNNFVFLNPNNNNNENEEITEEEVYKRLLINIGYCFDIVPKSEEYYNLFVNYPTIAANSNVIFMKSWKNIDMTSYLDISIKDLEIQDTIKSKLPELFIDIFHYTSEIYTHFSNKSGIELMLGQKNFSNVCEFYSSKYKEYKNVLLERQKKYNEAYEIIEKVKEIIERLNKEIDDCNPACAELDKGIEEKQKTKNEKTTQKNGWRNKKLMEEKAVTNLEAQRKEKQSNLDSVLQPFEDAITKVTTPVNKIQPADLTEIKNTWDNFAFGKFILQKIYELLGETNTEWENIKKTLDIKMIKSLIALNPVKNKEKYLNITKEITTSPEFSSGDNKFQKPYKICGTLCDYFNGCKNYFKEFDSQKELIENIVKIKEEMEQHSKNIKDFIQKAAVLDNEINDIEININEIQAKKSNINTHLLKLKALKECFVEFTQIATEKTSVWKDRKAYLDIILSNFDFYLMVISSYLIYAAPLSYNYRKQYKDYLYSLAERVGIQNINQLNIYSIFLEVLDAFNKDKEFCSSIGQYNEFLADNFTMMYVMNEKIPYLLDNNRMSPEIISTFLELKNPKVIIKATYNDVNEQGDMFDKLENAMKNGSVLFIEQCEENIYNIMENLILNKFTYAEGTNCYFIKNKNMPKNPKFKLYFVNNKSTSKISYKAFENCYIINFNCPRYIINNYIYDSICKEQNPAVFSQSTKIKNDISKDEYRLLELERKILSYNKQFDLSYNLDKVDFNRSLLEKYKVETTSHNSNKQKINNNKKRISIYKAELKRFENISEDASRIYKFCKCFSEYDNLYILPVEYLTNLVKEFYKNKFGLFTELCSQKKNKKKANDDDDNEEEPSVEEKDEEANEEGGNDEEALLEAKLKEQIAEEDEFPTYKFENAPELIIFLYNKISQIYDLNNKKYLLLLLLFFGLKQKEEIPTHFKQIIKNINKIFFKGMMEKAENSFKSPIPNHISDNTWNCLKQINDSSSYIFSIILDHIENHPQEWDTLLEEDEVLIETNFTVSDEDLASTINPFTKFLFFSIIKPHLSDSLITSILNDILKNDDNEFIVNQIEEGEGFQKQEIIIEKSPNIEDVFFQNIQTTRKPIIIFDKQNGELMVQKEIKEFYLNKLKSTGVGEGGKPEISSNEVVTIKEINPTKLELTTSELDTIHSSMKLGGVIFINNYELIKDSLIKIIEEIKDKNAVLHENFKLIILVNNKYLLPSYFYESCYIINRDVLLLDQMKDYLIDLIISTPTDFFNKLMNCENNNISAYYLRKMYIFFSIIHTVLVQYSCLKTKMFKIPIEYGRKEYYAGLNYLVKYFNSISEDKQKELHNIDNFYGFTYESLIKLINDIFINSRLIYKEDYECVLKFVTNLLESSSFMKNETLFSYDDFILFNIDEKKYPVINSLANVNEDEENNNDDVSALNNNSNSNSQAIKYSIPKSALLEQLEKIPNEKYYCLMYGISQKMISNKTDRAIRSFFEVVGKISKSEYKDDIETLTPEKDMNKLIVNNIIERLNELKRSLPDSLNTTDASSILFKVNKYNELFNPLDESLTYEINAYNTFLSNLNEDIANLLSVIQGNMVLIKDYMEMIQDLNINKVPKRWYLNKIKDPNKSKDIDEWLKQIKKKYDFFNQWILDGTVKVYDLSNFSNERLFMTLLPIYFTKKLNDDKISSDKVKIELKLTKYECKDEITDEILSEYKKINNNNKEFIFIKGLRIKGFEGHKEEEKELKTFTENDNNPNGELLPLICLTYTIEEYLNDVNIKNNNGEEESEEEDDENEVQVSMNQQKKEEKAPEQPQPAGAPPKDDEEKEKEGGEKEEQAGGEIAEQRKVVVEETEVKKMTMLEVTKIRKSQEVKVSVIKKTKIKYYKKHCKLDIPFVEEEDPDVYGINEPYGYIEIKFDCDKDKQEEYFVNKKISLVLDK